MRHAVILFAHGSRNPRWAEPLEALAQIVRAHLPEAEVRLAYLELMSPDLPAAIDAAVVSGVTTVQVEPVFWATGGHVERDLGALVAAARATHPTLAIAVGSALGQAPSVLAAMAAEIAARSAGK
jgi:sirohydrochlorin cobaltochelatase